MSATPLKAGDTVTLLHERPHRVTGTRPEHEIGYAGVVGFVLKGGGFTYYWHDRGIVWASEKLNRLEATKDRFSRTANGEGKTT